MQYDLRNVIEECLSEKSKVMTVERGKTMGAKEEIYSEAWSSLNAWIESKLCKRKVFLVSRFPTFANIGFTFSFKTNLISFFLI